MKYFASFVLLVVCASASHEKVLDMEWKENAQLPFPRSDMSATTHVGADQVTSIYVVGGCSANQILGPPDMYICPEITDKCTAFVPSTNSHTACASAPRARYRHAAANVNGKVWLVGGRDAADKLITEIDVYDPATNTWTTPYVWKEATSDLAAFTHQSILFLVGGYEADYTASNLVWELDTAADVLSTTPGVPLLEGRGDIAAGFFDTSSAFISGGFTHENWCQPHKSVEKYDFAKREWSYVADLEVGKGDKSLVGLEGKLFAIGGEHNDNCTAKAVPMDEVEVYDAVHNVWVAETKIPEKRFRFVAAADPKEGSFYVFGGQKYYNKTCDCFEVASDVLSYYHPAVHADLDLYSAAAASTSGVVGALLLVLAVLYP